MNYARVFVCNYMMPQFALVRIYSFNAVCLSAGSNGWMQFAYYERLPLALFATADAVSADGALLNYCHQFISSYVLVRVRVWVA